MYKKQAQALFISDLASILLSDTMTAGPALYLWRRCSEVYCLTGGLAYPTGAKEFYLS